MKQYWVDVVRMETEYNRYSTWVEAESAEEARAKVREQNAQSTAMIPSGPRMSACSSGGNRAITAS